MKKLLGALFDLSTEEEVKDFHHKGWYGGCAYTSHEILEIANKLAPHFPEASEFIKRLTTEVEFIKADSLMIFDMRSSEVEAFIEKTTKMLSEQKVKVDPEVK